MEYINYIQQREEKAIADIDETIAFIWKKQVGSPIRYSNFWMSMIDNLLDKRNERTRRLKHATCA